MKAAVVQNGVVLNVIEVESLDVFPGLVLADADAEPGGTFDGVKFARRVPSAAELAAAALQELAAIDLASIRALREYVASKPDAPQILKDREAAAVAARAKLGGV